MSDDPRPVLACVRTADRSGWGFPDDIHTFCAKCAVAIVHRPKSAPANAIAMCMHCAIETVPRPRSVNVTQESIDELTRHIRQRAQNN